jgi:hypothetical protein
MTMTKIEVLCSVEAAKEAMTGTAMLAPSKKKTEERAASSAAKPAAASAVKPSAAAAMSGKPVSGAMHGPEISKGRRAYRYMTSGNAEGGAKGVAKDVSRDISGRAAGILGGAALATKDQSRTVQGAKGLGENIVGRWGGGLAGGAVGTALKGTKAGKVIGAGIRNSKFVGARVGGASANADTIRRGLKNRKEYAEKHRGE